MKKGVLALVIIISVQLQIELAAQERNITTTNELLSALSVSNGEINFTNGRATAQQIYTTDPAAPNFKAINFSTSFAETSPKFGDKIRFTNTSDNRLITKVEVGLFHLETDPQTPITLEISMYSDCPAINSETQGFACGSGVGTLIPGSTMTLPSFYPPNGAYLKTFDFATPVNVYGYGNEITVVFKAVSTSSVYMLGNTPIIVGSLPIGEAPESRYAICGEAVDIAGCDFTFPTHITNNILINIMADEDDTPPTAVCQDITVTLNPFISNTIVTPAMINGGSTDGEGDVTLTIPPFGNATMNCSNLGNNVVTLNVTDRAGNTATCTANVTVEPSELTMGCPSNVVLNAGANCNAEYTPPLLLASQSCESVTITQTSGPTGIATLPIGVTTYSYTANSTSGDSVSCSYTVTVVDNTVPVIENCPTNITVSSEPDACGANVSFTTPSITDNCLAFWAQVQGLSSGSFFPVGTTTNTFVGSDFGGHNVVCEFTVTVLDTNPPQITCPANATVECTGGNITISDSRVFSYNGAPQSWTDAQYGNVVNATLDVATIPTGAVITDIQIGVNMDHSWLEDIGLKLVSPNGTVINLLDWGTLCEGQGDTDNIAAIFKDSAPFTAPEICEGLIFTGDDSENCPQYYLIDAGISGAVKPQDQLNALLSENLQGIWELRVQDAFEFDGGCLHDFTLEIFYDLEVDPNSDPSITGIPTATDCVGTPTLSYIDSISTLCGNSKTITRTWEATDAAGNTDTCIQTITVVDTTPPVVTCPSDMVVLNDPNTCGANINYTVEGEDDCSSFTVTQTAGFASGTVFPVGTTLNTFNVTDVCGNTTTCSFSVTVQDNEAPTTVCQDITVQLDVNGFASIIASDIDNGSTDACGIGSLAIDTDTFNCANIGNNLVTLTVTDSNGNTSQCIATVTVEDTVAPSVVCQDITIQLDAAGEASILPSDIDNGSTDACGINNISIDIASFNCNDVGPNNVILTVTDSYGNTAQCTAVVTVQDVTPPLVACPANINVPTNFGVCGAQVTFANPTALDECGIASITQTSGLASGSTFPIGENTVIFEATDNSGNITTCSFTITVTDTEAPTMACQDVTIQLDEFGDATIVANDVDGGSNDPCGIDTLSIDIDTFNCSNVGPNSVTLMATDIYGNSSSCVAVVTVEDVTAPVAVCQNITVQLDATGTVTIDPELLDGGSTDACGIDTSAYSVDIDTFNCSNIGDNPVVLTITDVNGNTTTCNAIVTVEDTTGPELVCQDITIQLDENGEATITPEDVIATNTDPCGIDTTSVDISTFNCNDVGTAVTVTVFALDIYGNSSSCTAIVTVEDSLGPVFDAGTLPGPQTRMANENGEYILEDFTTGITVTDNCSDPLLPIVLGQDPIVGTVLIPGVYNITLFAEDELGNITEYVFELTIEEFLSVENVTINLSSITLYPNPVKTVLNIANPQQIALEQLSIYDINGRLVQKVALNNMGAAKTIDVSNLASASYLVIIQSEKGTMTKQLVKK